MANKPLVAGYRTRQFEDQLSQTSLCMGRYRTTLQVVTQLFSSEHTAQYNYTLPNNAFIFSILSAAAGIILNLSTTEIYSASKYRIGVMFSYNSNKSGPIL